MKSEQIRLDRGKLYERVWSVPISRLAPEYGLSDVGLAKVCKRLNVPRPGLGHWAKVKAGRAAKRPPLPPWPVSEVVIAKREARTAAPIPMSDAPRVPVPPLSENPHALVRKTMQALEHARPDHQGVLQLPRSGLLAIHVTPGTKDRALRIVDALLRSLESRGHRVGIDRKDNSPASVEIGGELIGFSMHEAIERSEHVPTRAELMARKRQPWSHAPRFDFAASGRLSLRIRDLEWTRLRHRWTDGKKQRLEDRLGQFVVGLELAAAHKRDVHLRQAERERQREQERLQEEKRRRHREYERQLISALEQQAANWKKATELRAFLDEVERAAPNDSRDAMYTAWLGWARNMVDQLDPFSYPSSIPRPISPS